MMPNYEISCKTVKNECWRIITLNTFTPRLPPNASLTKSNQTKDKTNVRLRPVIGITYNIAWKLYRGATCVLCACRRYRNHYGLHDIHQALSAATILYWVCNTGLYQLHYSNHGSSENSRIRENIERVQQNATAIEH